MTMRDLIESRGGFGAFFRLEPAAPTEIDNFLATFPTVSARLVAAGVNLTVQRQPARLFELGETYYQRQADGVGVGPEVMRGLADQHSRNGDAQVDGDLVKSRFVLDPAVQDFWPQPIAYDTCGITNGYRPTRVVDVVTSLGQHTTVMTIEKLPLVV